MKPISIIIGRILVNLLSCYTQILESMCGNSQFLHAAAGKQQVEDAGYSSIQVNFELLTETVDPQNVLVKSFSHKLISLEEMKEIERIQLQSGRKKSCEVMIYLLLKEWRSESYNRFLEVLNSCNYEECAVQLQSNLIATVTLFYLALCFLFSSPSFLITSVHIICCS